MSAKKGGTFALLAQLDRVFGYEPKGRGFESLLAYQKSLAHTGRRFLLFMNRGDSNPERACGEKGDSPGDCRSAARCAVGAERRQAVQVAKQRASLPAYQKSLAHTGRRFLLSIDQRDSNPEGASRPRPGDGGGRRASGSGRRFQEIGRFRRNFGHRNSEIFGVQKKTR